MLGFKTVANIVEIARPLHAFMGFLPSQKEEKERQCPISANTLNTLYGVLWLFLLLAPEIERQR